MSQSDGERFAEAALEFVGVPFMLYGRDPNFGLDCVGLVAASLRAIGRDPIAPVGYRLRNTDYKQWLEAAQYSALIAASEPIVPGDIILTKPGPAQQHLIIAAHNRSIVHAHAGLKRVVQHPFASDTVLLRHWRLADQYEEF